MIDSFFAKINTLTPKQYDEKYLVFLKDFTLKALENYFDLKNNEMSMHESHSADFDSQCDQREMEIVK
jgi:hypothetical protein